jgi:FAD/FMN-containing dehydrogenase/Fe-S oxidoreductase
VPAQAEQEDTALFEALKQRVKGDVRCDELTRALYRTDASIYEIEPLGVVLPRDADDVTAAVQVAAQHGAAVLPRGGGTSLAGQTVGAAVHLDVSKYMNRVLELNAEERWVRVQPGVVLDELNAFLKPHGLLFGPDVSTSSRANIGGMMGNNSCGAHSLIYGKTVDHVIETQVVLADGSLATFGPLSHQEAQGRAGLDGLEGQVYGEIIRLARDNATEIEARFPKVMRRVSGYNLDEFTDGDRPFNLSKVMVGSEGTLGVVVEAKLNLVELPAHTAWVACHFEDLIEALEANIEALKIAPSAIELTDKLLLDLTNGSIEYARYRSFIQGDPAAMLFVEFYGQTKEELWEKMEALEAGLRAKGLGYAYYKAVSPEDQQKMRELRKAGLGLLMGMKGDPKPTSGTEDTCVPVGHLPEYVGRVKELMQANGVEAVYYGHASVGVLHIRPVLDLKKAAGIQTLRALEEGMCAMVKEYGGAMSAEHGDGLARSEFIERMFGPRLVQAFAAVKKAFDPQGIMNPGKIVDAQPMDQNLRYGEQYHTAQVETHFSFAAEGGLQQAVELCSGVGHCRKKLVGTMCPSYMATLEEEHSTRGRANALRAALSGKLGSEGLTDQKVYEAMELCLECKACKSECPSNVDMAKLKYEFLAQYHAKNGYPLRSHLFAKIDRVSRWASKVAPVANWIMGSSLNRWFLDRFIGIDARRQLPRFTSDTFSKWFNGRKNRRSGDKGKVLLFNDTFVEYNEPQIGIAATLILEAAGYQVEIPATKVCCGRPMISKGFLKEAKQRAQENIEVLAPYAEAGMPIIGLEPSCALSFSDDYLDLCDDPRARTVADKVQMLEDFLVERVAAGEAEFEFTRTRRQILVHGHCHQKALVGTKATLEVLNMPPNFSAAEIPSGCCGMAGSFGYEKEHYEVSMQVGRERLFRAVEEAEADSEIAAVGTSCRHQIADATGKKARHWAEILVEAL